MANLSDFEAMKGSEVLAFVHKIVLDTAAKRRMLLEQSAKISQNPISATERQEVRALEAAADMIQLAIAVGQDHQARKVAPPEWVLLMAGQGRSTMRNTDFD